MIMIVMRVYLCLLTFLCFCFQKWSHLWHHHFHNASLPVVGKASAALLYSIFFLSLSPFAVCFSLVLFSFSLFFHVVVLFLFLVLLFLFLLVLVLSSLLFFSDLLLHPIHLNASMLCLPASQSTWIWISGAERGTHAPERQSTIDNSLHMKIIELL